ncbi:Serine/threonine-protein kinase PknB [Stieleria maiorica]|uniref:Serine/threonine-protein kinase PknB n=1 Tax=Stieleria maiorica TaxID=2795974 RepID=A0A5B9MPP6_9BACT|nr:serine/threonine-protein kinase [Stieleria maiorica]QEG02884.1 Serine/threonine-protein kinase PknB [Stieleria maiorica]
MDCPTEESLRMLLSGGYSVHEDLGGGLLDHVGQCESCQRRLESLADVDVSDVDRLETLLGDQHLAWPTIGVDEERRIDAASQTEQLRSNRSPTDPSNDPTLAQTHDMRLAHDIRLGSKAVTAGNGSDRRASAGAFGDYELLRQIGAGGMGVVYKARQKSANRIVAVKLIRPDQLSMLTPERAETWKKRFRAEAQAAARLDHDHVVTIYEVGEVDGTLFYSMQFIDGSSLSSVVQDNPIENRRVAALMAKVAGAVDHAHQSGILHRDLKPQNILLRESRVSSFSSAATLSSHSVPQRDAAGGDSSDRRSVERNAEFSERPYVADFGLAKATDEGIAGSTHTGEVMGSPSFMSPEQAQDASRCTQASDIYSLGATLYFCLTGRPPFRSASAIETLRQVIDEEPVEPRELNRAIDADLQTITLKALFKEPAKRYASAADLADDLNRYLRGEPILARPVSRVERSIRWCRRNPMVATLASGIAMLLIVIATISLLSSIRLRQHVQRESEARKEAEEFFSVSLNVIHEMVTSYASDSLEHVPQMQTARRELLHRALSLYERLSQSRPSNPQLWNQYARTRYRIALLHSLLGETHEAQLAFRDAIAVLDSLIEASPDDMDLQVQWARSHAMLGETLRITNPETARVHFQRGLSLQTKFHRQFPENTDYKLECSRTLNNLGLLLTQTGEFSVAEDDFNSAIELLRELADDTSLPITDRSRFLADLARSQINLGVLLRKFPGRVDGAHQSYELAIKNLEQALALEPDNRDHQFRLAVAEVDLGNLLLTGIEGGKESALGFATDATQRLTKLFDEFPGIPIYLYESANAGNSVAGALAMLGRRQESMTEFQNAVGRLELMTDKFPEFAETEARFHSLRGRLLGGIGYLHSQNGDWDTAKQYVDQAIVNQRAALRRQPLNPEIQDFLDQHLAFEKSVSERLDD